MDIRSNILIINENSKTNEKISGTLKKAGFTNIITAKDRGELDSCMKSSKDKINIVISSFTLQDKDLQPVLKKLRNENPKLIMLIVTGKITISVCRRAWECRFDFFLDGSASSEEIIALLKKAFRIHDENKKYITEDPEYPDRIIDTLKTLEGKDDEDDETAVNNALLSLQKCKDKRLLPFLLLMLEHPSEAVREKSVFLLGKLNDQDAVEPLVKILSDSSESSNVRTGAVGALKTLGKEDIAQPFLDAIKQKSTGKRQKRLTEGGDIKQRISSNIYVESNNGLLYLFFRKDIADSELNKVKVYFSTDENNEFFEKFRIIHINLCLCGKISKNINLIIDIIKDKFEYTVLYLNKNKPELVNLTAGLQVPKIIY